MEPPYRKISTRKILVSQGPKHNFLKHKKSIKKAFKSDEVPRIIKKGIDDYAKKVYKYLDKISIPVEGDMLKNVASISCNNDKNLGDLISGAYNKVGKSGVVLMEESETDVL